MDEYQKTLSMLDYSQEQDDSQMSQKYFVQLPQNKRLLVMPIINEILRRVDMHIEDRDEEIKESKRQTERLKQMQYQRSSRIDNISA
jgi:hypothetical protein